MKLFRVKDCKQMAKKKPMGFLPRLGFTFIVYNINIRVLVICWAVLLSLFFYLIGLVVSAIHAPFLGIIMMRYFGGTIR